MMDANEYLDNYCLGAIDTNSIKPVLLSVNQLGIIMNGFHQIKSKEEAGDVKKQLKVCIRESRKAANNFKNPQPVMAAYSHMCLTLQSILRKLP